MLGKGSCNLVLKFNNMKLYLNMKRLENKILSIMSDYAYSYKNLVFFLIPLCFNCLVKIIMKKKIQIIFKIVGILYLIKFIDSALFNDNSYRFLYFNLDRLTYCFVSLIFAFWFLYFGFIKVYKEPK